MSEFSIIFVLLLAYAIGAIPSAYLLVKWVYHLDVTQRGSGNVGTLNALRTTRSKWLSALVLIADFAKGAVAVWLIRRFFPESAWLPYAAAFLAVLGHNYSLYLKGKGGRGLATAAGGLSLLAPQILGIWLVLWLITYLLVRQIIYSSVIVTLLIYGFLWWPSERFVTTAGAVAISGIAALILIKHIPRMREVWQARHEKGKKEGDEYAIG